jgi:hypothetical protein
MTQKDPKMVAARLRNAIEDLENQLRMDVREVDDPRAQVLFETSAETLKGLVTAFQDFDAGKEAAFRR